MRTIGFVGLVAVLVVHTGASAGTTYYATTTPPGGICKSWAGACSLSSCIALATNGDQIWVKAGTYTGPLDLPNGVKIIGGFAGMETQASQSNPTTNVTIITVPANNRALFSTDSASSTVLRGFTIKNGVEAGDGEGGGGLLAVNSSALFVQCIFENNTATHFGGAVMIRGSGGPAFINCIFRNNGTGAGSGTTPLGGGAVYLQSGTPSFTNCLFYLNRAVDGGAIMADDGLAILINCTLAQNSAGVGDGGAIYDPRGRVRVRNTILWSDTVPTARSGPEIFNNTDMYQASVTYTNVQGGFTGVGNINTDPTFVNAGGGDFKLSLSSACLNAGSNSALPTDAGDLDWDGNTNEGLPRDLAGNNRKMNFTVDIGAYERNSQSE